MQFGGNVAVNDVSLSIRAGEIVGLIGPNGSGKTTLFNCISRVYTPTAGRACCSTDKTSQIWGAMASPAWGVGRTYQIPRPFSDLTVQENIAIPLMFGANLAARCSARGARLRRLRGTGRGCTTAPMRCRCGRRRRSSSRALACRPRLLLVDEVASG